MVVLFNQPQFKSYRAPALSCSFIFCVFLLLIAIILPFFLAFSTYDFWKKQETFLEQPKVLYRKELLVAIQSESTSISGSSISSTTSSHFFSTLGKLNEMYFESLFPMKVESSLIDFNFDKHPDSYEFNITAKIPSSQIRNIKILSFYDYRIKKRVSLEMIGMALANIDTPSGAGYVFIDGSLDFQQQSMLKKSKIINTYYNETVLSNSSAAENSLERLIMRFNDRNFTTKYNYDYTAVQLNQGYTQIFLKVRIPINQKFEYSPGFLEVMKFSWIQYLSLLIPVGYFIYSFAKFIYSNQILESQVNFSDKLIK